MNSMSTEQAIFESGLLLRIKGKDCAHVLSYCREVVQSGLAAVVIDCPEALAAARQILPGVALGTAVPHADADFLITDSVAQQDGPPAFAVCRDATELHRTLEAGRLLVCYCPPAGAVPAEVLATLVATWRAFPEA